MKVPSKYTKSKMKETKQKKKKIYWIVSKCYNIMFFPTSDKIKERKRIKLWLFINVIINSMLFIYVCTDTHV